MAQRLAGGAKGTKHAAAAAPEDAQAAKRQKGGGGAGGGDDARRGEDADAGGGFQKPAAYDGGRFFSPQKSAPQHKKEKAPKGHN
jgi:hypothetical protein